MLNGFSVVGGSGGGGIIDDSVVRGAIVLLRIGNFGNINSGNGKRIFSTDTTANESMVKAHLAILELSKVVSVRTFG